MLLLGDLLLLLRDLLLLLGDLGLPIRDASWVILVLRDILPVPWITTLGILVIPSMRRDSLPGSWSSLSPSNSLGRVQVQGVQGCLTVCRRARRQSCSPALESRGCCQAASWSRPGGGRASFPPSCPPGRSLRLPALRWGTAVPGPVRPSHWTSCGGLFTSWGTVH